MKKLLQFLKDLKLLWRMIQQDRATNESKIRVNISPENLLKFMQGDGFIIDATFETMHKLVFYDIIIALNDSITDKDYLEAEMDYRLKAKERNLKYENVRNPIKTVIKSYTKKDLVKHLHSN